MSDDAEPIVPQPRAAWLLALPPALMLAYIVAFKCLREQPANALGLCVLLAAMAGVLALAGRPWARERHLAVHAALVAAWVAWTAALIPLHPEFIAQGVGWLGATCAGALLFLAVTQADAPGHERGDACLLIAGAASGLAYAVCAVVGPLIHFLDVGLGNVNHTICAFDAPLWAGAVLLAWRILAPREMEGRISLMAPACIALGILALLWMCLASPIGIRRGGVLAGAAAAACAAASWGWSRHRRITAAACAAAAALVVAIAIYVRVPQEFSAAVPSFRYSRVALYRACLDRAREVLPTGDGAFAAERITRSHGESARHWSAAGNWLLGAHNDLLDAVLDRGVPMAVLWLALAASLAIRAWRVEDDGQRAACVALLAVLFVHAMTDNAYAVPSVRALIALPCALVFCCPARTRAAVVASAVPAVPAAQAGIGPQLAALPLMAVVTWCAIEEIPAATVSIHGDPFAHLRVLERTQLPQPLVDEFSFAYLGYQEVGERARARSDRAREDAALQAQRLCLDRIEARLGQVARIPFVHADFAIAQLDADRRSGAARAVVDQDSEAAVRALLRVIERFPFEAPSYRRLLDVLDIDDSAVHLVPPAVAIRANYLAGAPGMSEPSLLDPPSTVDEAADRFAALAWWFANRKPLERAAPAVIQLVLAYGDIPGVSELGARLIVQSHGDGEDLVRTLDPGMRIGFVDMIQPANQYDIVIAALQIDHPQPAAALLRHFYPGVWSHVASGRYRVRDDEDPAVCLMCGVVYAALRRAERPEHAAHANP